MNTNTGFAAIRIAKRLEAFKKSANNVLKKLSSFPNQPVRVSTKLAKHILINHPTIIASGKMYSTQVRNVGAGVKELYLKEKSYE